MSADQLRRAADAAQRRAVATYRLDEASDAMAELLRAAVDSPLGHSASRAACRVPTRRRHPGAPGPCPACLLDDVAAAYLGEEPQP